MYRQLYQNYLTQKRLINFYYCKVVFPALKFKYFFYSTTFILYPKPTDF